MSNGQTASSTAAPAEDKRDIENVTMIAANTSFSGDIADATEVRIFGTFKGTISCQRLMIAEAAVVEAEIRGVEVVKVSGFLKGTVQAKRILICKQATVEAELHGDEIGMELGAKIRGSLDTIAATGIELRETAVVTQEAQPAAQPLAVKPQAAQPSPQPAVPAKVHPLAQFQIQPKAPAAHTGLPSTPYQMSAETDYTPPAPTPFLLAGGKM